MNRLQSWPATSQSCQQQSEHPHLFGQIQDLVIEMIGWITQGPVNTGGKWPNTRAKCLDSQPCTKIISRLLKEIILTLAT